MLLARGLGGPELRPITALAALDFGELGNQLPIAAAQVVGHGGALRLKPKT